MTDPLNYFSATGVREDLEFLIKDTVKDLVKIKNLTQEQEQEQAMKLVTEQYGYLSKNYEAAINKQVLLDACLNKL